MVKLSYRVTGLDCAEEVKLIRHALAPHLHDDDDLAFDLLRGRLTISCVSGRCHAPAIERAIAETGMAATPWSHEPAAAKRGRDWRGRVCALSGVALALAVAGDIAARGPASALGLAEAEVGPSAAVIAAYGVSIAAGLWFILPKAWYALRRVRPDINLLVVIAAAGAAVLGEWHEAATVAWLFAVAILLESWSVGRARRAIEALVDLTPRTARTVCSHGETERPVEQVKVGARVRVRPGERTPLDGRILDGSTSINEAPITGESIPKQKSIGDEVYAGTINNEGVFDFEVTRPADDTTLARILRMVEEAQARRAPAEQWVDRFALYYTPIMMAVAVAAGLVAMVVQGTGAADAVYLALVILLIACPCALVISTPVSVVAGLAHAAREGVLIKGGAYLEAPGQLKAIAFDKTGTLTQGRPQVEAVRGLRGHDEGEVLRIGAAIESQSNHPLALAIVAEAARRELPKAEVEGASSISGKGAEARIGGALYWAGSERLVKEKGFDDTLYRTEFDAFESKGMTAVIVGDGEGPIGIVALADSARPESAGILKALKNEGIAHTVLLTGDNPRTAAAIAAELGLDAWEAGLLPEDKTARVEALVREYGRVAMVGDGVNDAPAMAAANLSIAMGAAGSDAAIETADVALMADDLTKLPWLVGHSRRVLSVIRQNIVIALGLKLAVLALALFGVATLWLAILADMGASLIVIFNALRLLK